MFGSELVIVGARPQPGTPMSSTEAHARSTVRGALRYAEQVLGLVQLEIGMVEIGRTYQ